MLNQASSLSNENLILKNSIHFMSGGFSEIYKTQLYLIQYIIKVANPNFDAQRSLFRESKALVELKGIKGIPQLIYNGVSHKKNFIIMEDLGSSLSDLLKEKMKFSLSEICNVACQILQILKNIHKLNYIHRDIKPSNVMKKDNDYFLIDFGFSKKVNKKKNQKVFTKNFKGTPLFSSRKALLGVTQCPIDDLESLGYLLLNLNRDEVPWKDYVNIREISIKKDLFLKDVKSQKFLNIPVVIAQYFELIDSLKRNDKINYEKLIDLFMKESIDENLNTDYNELNNFNENINESDSRISEFIVPCLMNKKKGKSGIGEVFQSIL